jgi:hypothetical protein
MTAPTYTVLTLNGHARHYLIDRCDDCGALVQSRTTHDAWHACVDAALEWMAGQDRDALHQLPEPSPSPS